MLASPIMQDDKKQAPALLRFIEMCLPAHLQVVDVMLVWLKRCVQVSNDSTAMVPLVLLLLLAFGDMHHQQLVIPCTILARLQASQCTKQSCGCTELSWECAEPAAVDGTCSSTTAAKTQRCAACPAL